MYRFENATSSRGVSRRLRLSECDEVLQFDFANGGQFVTQPEAQSDAQSAAQNAATAPQVLRVESASPVASPWERVALAVTLSVLAHLLISVGLWYFAPPASSPVPRVTLLEWYEPTTTPEDAWKNQARQVVRGTDVPPEAQAPDREVERRFLSDERRTVVQETRAAASGLTENRGGRAAVESAGSGVPRSQSQSSFDQQRRQAAKPTRPALTQQPELGTQALEGDLAVAQKNAEDEAKPLHLPFDPRIAGASTFGENVPDAQLGNFTALNTDRFTYYSFYARVEEQIRHRWVKFVRAAVYGGEVPPTNRQLETRLEIVLDREGRYLRSILHQTSGVKILDRAPARAFAEAQRIPHPPREMVKDDGTIRLMYAFNVEQVPVVAVSRRRSSPDSKDAEAEDRDSVFDSRP